MKFTLLIFCSLVFSQALFSQTTKIEPSRPDQSESASLVPKGFFQAETGFVYEKDNSESISKNYTYPTILMRYGLFDNLEIRTQIDNYRSESSVQSGSGQEVSTVKKGLKPLSLGIKMKMFDEDGLIPDAAFVADILLPKFGSDDLQIKDLGSIIQIAFSNTLAKNMSLDYNLGALWTGASSEAVLNYTFELEYTFLERFKVFAEVYGYAPENTQADHRFDFGAMVNATNNLAFDASAGFGLTSNAPDFFINGGFSFRLPK